MNYRHAQLAKGRWAKLSFCEQMANIGSEVERIINWRAKNNTEYSHQAFERALELIDLTLDNLRGLSRLKEIARLREVLADYFIGTNQYKSTDISWRKYFAFFDYAARKNC